MGEEFPAAPWSASLKVISLLAFLMLLLVMGAAFRVGPEPGLGGSFRAGLALVPLAVLLGGLAFVVRGYAVGEGELRVTRLLTTTRVSLAGLRRAWIDPEVRRGSIRIFGNGGLFSFSGWFYSQRLGRYRLFATDFRRCVVLSFDRRKVVVSPADAEAFLQRLGQTVPGIVIGPAA